MSKSTRLDRWERSSLFSPEDEDKEQDKHEEGEEAKERGLVLRTHG